MTRRRRALVWGIAAIAAILLIGRVVSAAFVDYQWFAEMQATDVWRVRMANLLLRTGVTALLTVLFVFANIYAVRRSIVSVILPRRMGNLEIGEEVPGRYLTTVAVVLSVVIGILLALPPEPWTELAAARYGLPFGESDPYFQADLGFFVYWLPFENSLYVRALLVLLVTVCVVIVLYFAVTPSLRWDRTRFRVTAHVRRHAAMLTPFFFGIVAWMYRLDAYSVLSHGAGPNGAFTYTDHRFMIPADRVLGLATLAAGVVAGWTLWRGQLRSTLVVITATLVLPLAVFQIAPSVMRHLTDAPDLARREQPYAVIRSQATRAAYGVSRLTPWPRSLPSPARLTSLADAVSGVSVWDPAALTIAVERAVRRGTVADAVGWKQSLSGLLALAIGRADEGAPGEGQPTGVADGVVMPVRATSLEDRGQAARTDLQGLRGVEEIAIPPVLIYEGATEPLTVADSLDRIVAPRFDGLGARLAQAWSAQRLSLLAEDLPEPHPKLVAHRDVRERVHELIPFFAQGSTVWPLVTADSLYWVVDLYSSVPDTYPLSQHFTVAREDRSYFQHAATAIVHAYTGRVVVVADSARDPIADTWMRRFPSLFVPWASVPSALATQTPAAVDGGLATAYAFAAAGGGSRLGFVSGDSAPPARRLALVDNADTVLASGQPPCVAPRQSGGACIWSVPVIDAADRVTGLVTAVGGLHRALVWTPLDSSGPRWPAALDRLQRTGDSAAGRRDGPVARGRVRAVLVGSRLALVQPQYAWRADAPPTVLSIAVVVGDSSAAGPTLADALGIADTAVTSRKLPPPNPPSVSEFRARLGALYDAMQAALRRGDLTAFGAAYAELGRLLGRTGDTRRPPPPTRPRP